MTQLTNRIRVVALASSIFAIFSSTATANVHNESIKIQVQLFAPHDVKIRAVGFSVGDRSTGSLGKITTKNGPAGGLYAFGIQRSDGLRVSCGSARLLHHSLVKLTYDGKICRISRIFIMHHP